MKAEKAQGGGAALAPPPPGNAAIKGTRGAIKGSSTGQFFSDESPKKAGARREGLKGAGRGRDQG